MNISIITVYNSHNYGSFLQAQQLYKVLEKYGNVSFYNSHSRKLVRSSLRKSKRILLSSKKIKDLLKGFVFEFFEMCKLLSCWRGLPSSESLDNTDIAVLGSDEIWNITRAACRYPVYWGAGIRAFKIAYAPSVNNAEASDLERCQDYRNCLRRWGFPIELSGRRLSWIRC